MSNAYLRAAIAIAVLVPLSACGGGGGARPIPTPPPPPVAPEAFPLTKSGTFNTINGSRSYHYAGNIVVDGFDGSSGSAATISYDAATNSYTVKSGSLSASFDSSNLTSSSYIDTYSKNSTSVSDELKLYNNVRSGSSQASAPVQLSYLSYGIWTHKESGSPDEYSKTYMLFGYPTAVSSMPVTGSATYKTDVTASLVDLLQSTGEQQVAGTATFTADFANAKISTDLALSFASTGVDLGTYNGVAAISGNQFSGDFQSADHWFVSGKFSGGFFGPSAKEMGYTFAIKRGAADPYAGTTVAPFLSWINGAVVGTKN